MTNRTHTPRLDMEATAPKIYAAMREFGKSYADSGLDPALCEMLKVRASQINGCAFCLEMHVREARERGVTDDRLHMLAAWREAPCFTDAERAALELTEAVTRIAEDGVGDDVYERARLHYTEQQYIGLLAAINVINAWNRFMVGVGAVPPRR